jgi:translation initiation factor IF-2
MDALRRKAAGSTQITQNKSKKKEKKGKKKRDDDLFQAVAGTEAGGITQVVSAFQIRMPNISDSANSDIDTVTFLDTPGHAAFKSMRKSGSNGADVLVLVIAADDGVSPQTIELINMYKEIARAQPGSITLMVAMTKIDKPGIDIEQSMRQIENQLMEHEIFTERMTTPDCEFGGVQMVPLSGLTGEGIDDLVEGLILQSEVMDLRACRESRAEGLIIDAKVETGLGVVVDCIIRWGKLEVGDYVHSGVHGGKVRILNDVNNKSIKRASPSQPVRLVGFKSLPKAGDPILCVQSEEISKEIIARREALAAANDSGNNYRIDDSNTKLDVQISGGASKKGFMANNVLKKYNLHDEAQEDSKEDDEHIRIPVILKADADGTLAALRDSILAIQEQSSLNLLIDPIEISVGHVTPSDVNMAIDSGASIFCFNLKGSKDKSAMSLASTNNVDVRSNNVIYRLLEDAKDVFSGFCPPSPVEKIHGKALVQAVFDINNNKNAERVAGLKVTDGKLYLKNIAVESGTLNCLYRIKKKGKEVKAEGLTAKSLRRVKDEVTDVRLGDECGLNLEGFKDVEEGDVIECYSIEMKRKFV